MNPWEAAYYFILTGTRDKNFLKPKYATMSQEEVFQMVLAEAAKHETETEAQQRTAALHLIHNTINT